MALPREVKLTPQGGRYYPAMTLHWGLTILLMPLVLVMLFLAIINPFWFRDSMFRTIERNINRFAAWRGYRVYRVYLGCDPKVWHTLKGDK